MASGTYTATTLTQALTLLAGRLMDPTFVRWTAAELTIYVQQALRTWNSLTGFYRGRSSFTTTVNEPIYDLPTVLPTLRAQTYTDDEAITQMAYWLLEPPPVAGVWQGSGQFTLAQLVDALQGARDEFLLETGAVLTASTVPVDPVPADGRVDLSEDIANLRRAVWKTADGNVTILRRTDSWGLTQYASTSWATQDTHRPKAYSVGETPPLILQLAPIPSVEGDLQMVSVNRGTTIVPGTPASLGVPDDFAWVVIFGALADLLNKDGIAYDPSRAAYCEARWVHGLKMAKDSAVVMDARIQGAIVQMGSLSGADYFSSAWPMVSGNPNRVLTAGHTLVAVAPPPGVPVGGGQYTVLLDVVRNAPVPTAGGDFIQVGPELLDTILNYAQHLALFKEGTAQIQQAQGLLDRFMGMAGTEVKLEWALNQSLVAVGEQTLQDRRQVAYETTREGTIN